MEDASSPFQLVKAAIVVAVLVAIILIGRKGKKD